MFIKETVFEYYLSNKKEKRRKSNQSKRYEFLLHK